LDLKTEEDCVRLCFEAARSNILGEANAWAVLGCNFSLTPFFNESVWEKRELVLSYGDIQGRGRHMVFLDQDILSDTSPTSGRLCVMGVVDPKRIFSWKLCITGRRSLRSESMDLFSGETRKGWCGGIGYICLAGGGCCWNHV